MMKQSPKVASQYNILALDKSASSETKRKSLEVETTIDCWEGLPSHLSRNELPSWSSSASASGSGKGTRNLSPEEKLKKQKEKEKREADKKKKADALPMNQAIKFLKDIKDIAELKGTLVELKDKFVVQHVPESKRREWADTFKKYEDDLNKVRSDMEERVAVNNPKIFEDNGGKQALDGAKELACKASLDLKAWKSTYNVYLNANTAGNSSRSMK